MIQTKHIERVTEIANHHAIRNAWIQDNTAKVEIYNSQMANGLYVVLSKYSNDPCVGLEENKDRKIVSFPVEWLFVEPGNKKVFIIRPSMQYVNW